MFNGMTFRIMITFSFVTNYSRIKKKENVVRNFLLENVNIEIDTLLVSNRNLRT